MPITRRETVRAGALVAAALIASCVGSTGPEAPPELELSATTLALGTLREGSFTIRNIGNQAVGPVEMLAGAVRGPAGSTVPGIRLTPRPAEIPTLNPGDSRSVDIAVAHDGSMLPGDYDAVITASAGDLFAILAVSFSVAPSDVEAAASVSILSDATSVRAGDVIPLPVEVRDAAGRVLQGAPVSWSLDPAGAGLVGASGQMVGYRPGTLTLTATVGGATDRLQLLVVERGLSGDFSVVGRGVETGRFTSDLWLHGDAAYSGTWSGRQGPDQTLFGNTLFVWDVANPAAPRRAGSLELDARTVNDVKVRADGTIAVVTHEGSNDGLNGVTILGLDDPLRPAVLSRFTDGLQAGVHNVWVDGDYAYLVVDGVGNGLRVLDISNPAAPAVVASYWAGESFLHDVLVRDGLAFLSHWNAGLVILDVGHGIGGGSPESPVEVSRIALTGQTHNAWYWPDAGYVFVGEEDFSTPGITHVIDVRNLRAPREVATYAVPGQPPHNFWLDEASATLYLAWYGQGVRALDVSGDLLGALDLQQREVAAFLYNDGAGVCDRSSLLTCTWAPQLHEGLIWVSDQTQGLVALRPPR